MPPLCHCDMWLKIAKLASILDSLLAQTKPFFLVKLTGDTAELHSVDEADALLSDGASDSVSFQRRCTGQS